MMFFVLLLNNRLQPSLIANLLSNINFVPLCNILHTHHNIIVKYDVYDPNTDIKGTEIVSNLTSSDIKYSTLGIGYLFNYDQNWKFLIYKDFVKNESTSLSGYTSDVKKDNVLTLRIQYTFNKYQ